MGLGGKYNDFGGSGVWRRRSDGYVTMSPSLSAAVLEMLATVAGVLVTAVNIILYRNYTVQM